MSKTAYSYIRDPSEIYRQSFAAIRRETALSRVESNLVPLALRLVHACATPDIVNDLAASPGAARAGCDALANGALVLADVEMVARGIIANRLPQDNKVMCRLSDPTIPGLAKSQNTTRSAAAVSLWPEHLAGAIVAIGNAPTALFRLLEGLAEGWPAPALILGFPVGFIGATESKEALIDSNLGVPYITLRGRRGGSAMAAAAVNALTSCTE